MISIGYNFGPNQNLVCIMLPPFQLTFVLQVLTWNFPKYDVTIIDIGIETSLNLIIIVQIQSPYVSLVF